MCDRLEYRNETKIDKQKANIECKTSNEQANKQTTYCALERLVKLEQLPLRELFEHDTFENTKHASVKVHELHVSDTHIKQRWSLGWRRKPDLSKVLLTELTHFTLVYQADT